MLGFVAPATAQGFDYVIAGMTDACKYITSCPRYSLIWIGSPWRYEFNTDIRTLAARGNASVLGVVAMETASGRGRIWDIRPDGSRSPFFTFPANITPGPAVADRAGNVYVLTYGIGSRAIWKIDSSGILRNTYAIVGTPHGTDAIDLASDQCTMYMTATTSVRRLDVCAGSPDVDFAAVPATDVRILTDGTILVALDTGELRRIDARGVPLRTYTMPGDRFVSAMAVESTHSVIVSTAHRYDVSVGILYRLDLETGVASQTSYSEIELARSIVLARGFTAAIGPTGPAPEVPTSTARSLLILAIALATLAVVRLR